MMRFLRHSTSMRPIGTFAQGALAMLSVPVSQLIVLGFYAKVLGIQLFGTYLIITAVFPVLIEFLAIGAGERLIRDSSQGNVNLKREAGRFYGSLVSWAPLCLCILALYILIIDTQLPLATALLVGVFEVLGGRIYLWSEHFHLSQGCHVKANIARSLQSAPRLLSLGIVFMISVDPSIELIMMSASSIFFAFSIGLLIWTGKKFLISRPRINLRRLRDELTLGSPNIVRAVNGNIDRIVLGTTAGAALVGAFGAAQRVCQSSFVSYQSVLRYYIKDIFGFGARGIREGVRGTIRRALLPLLTASLGASLCLFFSADFLSDIFGDDFSNSEQAVRALSGVVVLNGLSALAYDILTSAGFYWARIGIMICGAICSGSAFFIADSLTGFVLATYTYAAFTFFLSWTAVILFYLQDERMRGAS